MNTNTGLDRRAAAWLADGPTELSDRVLDAALLEVHSTKQRRALRVPWRFPHMPAFTRATSIAAVALVAVVGAGSVLYLVTNRSGGTGTQTTPIPSTAPTPLPPGITGWTPYTSVVHGFTLGVPADWSLHEAATRTWNAGDSFPRDAWPFADSFISPGDGDASIGLFAWEMPAAEGVDIESLEGLKTSAETFCNDAAAPGLIASSCEEFAQDAVPMCLNAGGDACRAAILVPAAEAQFAFFVNFGAAMLSDHRVRVVIVGRADGFYSAAPYGGTVAFLKAILTTMDVWTPSQPQLPQGWIQGVTPGA